MMTSNILAGPPNGASTPIPSSSPPPSTITSATSLHLPLASFSTPPAAQSLDKQKLHLLQSMMSVEVCMMIEKRFEENYDLTNDLMYNAWKTCKLAVSAPNIMCTSTNISFYNPVNPDHNAASPSSHAPPMSIERFLESSTPRAPEKKRKRRDVLPNMALTSSEVMQYFEEQEAVKVEEERKKKNRVRIREEKKRQVEKKKKEKEEERKKKTEERKEREMEKKKNGKKGGKRKRTESSSDKDDMSVVLDDEPEVSDDGRGNVNECAGCKGVYTQRQAREWVGCNKCVRWYHKRCVNGIDLVGLDEEVLEELEFICDFCL